MQFVHRNTKQKNVSGKKTEKKVTVQHRLCSLLCLFFDKLMNSYQSKQQHYFLAVFHRYVLHSFDIQQHKVLDRFVSVQVEFLYLILVRFYAMKNDLHKLLSLLQYHSDQNDLSDQYDVYFKIGEISNMFYEFAFDLQISFA